MRKFLIRSLAVLLVLLLVVGTGGFVWVRHQLTASLPQLSGEIRVAGTVAPIRVERDDHGIPTVKASNRGDLAYGTGFAHGQDRFFQMDLLRRTAAGELAELFGSGVVDMDLKNRPFRFREHAQKVAEHTSPEDRAVVEAYVKGVNAGLGSLGNKPFEYLVLGQDPKPWLPEDVVLAALAMFIDLQGNDYQNEVSRAVVKETLPEPMYSFLMPIGNEWDAPIDGTKMEQPPIPGPEVFDLRAKTVASSIPSFPSRFDLDPFYPGSNNWAVAGNKSAHGGALLANDMHLRIGVPNIWYRASFVWPGKDGTEERITGATLPGTPVMVVGSNGHVAWGFTNSEGDWTDVVVVEVDPANKDQYLTPEGPKPFERHQEVIKVRGQPDRTLEVVDTIWGPILRHDLKNRPLAIHWIAQQLEGINFGLIRMESARNIEEAMDIANSSGSAEQNFVVADKEGNIGWTILGRVPQRKGADGLLPVSWADGTNTWDGYLTPEQYPRILNPENGRIWTANSRVVGGEMLKKVGVGGYDLGARAAQIRDDLLAIEKASEADMLKTQLDDRAVFLVPWHKHLLEVITPDAIKADPRLAELRKHLEAWGERASVDSIGYRMVHEYRLELTNQILGALTESCRKADKNFQTRHIKRSEGPVWRIVTEQPKHLLHPRFETWNDQFLAALDKVLDDSLADGRTWTDLTWGKFNTTKIQHPLSLGVPWLGKALGLDMPPVPLPGGPSNLPRIQRPNSGASERLAVSPGKEDKGYFHMATGQCGHPFSPHYSDGQKAWEVGEATPFLPGPTVNTLVLEPVGVSSVAADR